MDARSPRKHYPVAYLLRSLAVACVLPGILGLTIFLFVEYRDEKVRLGHENMQSARFLGQAIDNHLLRTQALARSFAQQRYRDKGYASRARADTSPGASVTGRLRQNEG